jgi:hypothetical protein
LYRYATGANTIRARTKVVNSCVFNSLPAWYVKGDFIVHLAGLKGVAKCLMFRHYYRNAKVGLGLCYSEVVFASLR